jgi:hypothetical protein
MNALLPLFVVRSSVSPCLLEMAHWGAPVSGGGAPIDNTDGGYSTSQSSGGTFTGYSILLFPFIFLELILLFTFHFLKAVSHNAITLYSQC